MTTSEGIENKVRRMDSNVHAIYAMLTDIMATQRRHGDRLDKMDGTLTDIATGKVLAHRRLDQIVDRVSGIECNANAMSDMQRWEERCLDQMDETLVDIDATLQTIVDLLRGPDRAHIS